MARSRNTPPIRTGAIWFLFYEYFHGETGRGCGASHQTGWTALAVKLLENTIEDPDQSIQIDREPRRRRVQGTWRGWRKAQTTCGAPSGCGLRFSISNWAKDWPIVRDRTRCRSIR